uniref:Uncharacterized protein n=1 Tax=Rhizophora mucronata TaxID=61149 RepID=A0A2P2PA83_RHIMU
MWKVTLCSNLSIEATFS